MRLLNPPTTTRTPGRLGGLLLICLLSFSLAAGVAWAEREDQNNPGVIDPMISLFLGQSTRIPNSDQSLDGDEQSTIEGDVLITDAFEATSMLGHPITRVESPNEDMRLALQAMAGASEESDASAMRAAAQELMDILLGTTEGRIYDGFGMLNFNRWKHPDIGPEYHPEDVLADEYKMKVARDSGETYTSPYDGEERKIWEVDINMLYYDGQIDSDTFLLLFPYGHHDDDTLRVNYTIRSLVLEDFSPTMVMLDKRLALNTVQFPFKGMDSVWLEFRPGEVMEVTVNYPPIRQIRGVYTWGWRVHPPRIQFLQPVYEIKNAHTDQVELDPQGFSYVYRNRENLTLDSIGSAAPEMKMYTTARAALDGVSPAVINKWLTLPNRGPEGTWIDWYSLATEQRQLPPEAWEMLADEGITPGDFGDYNIISVFLNNEMYGEGPFENEILGWDQQETFRVKLINLDNHTHYFRNVDFGTRLNDDILRCCGGGQTSFEVMNFKPSYGAPKVAEMQWRAGWGFRPHYDVVQQDGVFPRGSDRVKVRAFTGGEGDVYYGYQYSEEARGGDFRFNPPPFIIGVSPLDPNPSSDVLRDADGEAGLVIGQFTEGYGTGQMCPGDAYPGFCATDIAQYNPHGALNWPPPPLQGVDGNPDQPTELRFPPFLRNPAQGEEGAGDIIPPTGAWRPFLWTNPNNGTLYIDPEDPGRGYWADLTYSHGAPVFARDSRSATIELPRASGQVFYQFDDLFHDNSIFSPHPLFEGEDEMDEIVHLRAFNQNFLRVRGRLDAANGGKRSEWVTLHEGGADEEGCTGRTLAASPVDGVNGVFVFRCGQACSSPLPKSHQGNIPDGAQICVQSTIGAFAVTNIEP